MRGRTGRKKAIAGTLVLLGVVAGMGAGAPAGTGGGDAAASAPQQPSPSEEQPSPAVEQPSPSEQAPGAPDREAGNPVEPPAYDKEEPAAVQPIDARVEPRRDEAASSLGLSCSAGQVDFGGGMLAPGQTYTQSVRLVVTARGGWTLRMEQGRGLTGEATGATIPPSCVTIGVRPGGDGVEYAAPAGTHAGDMTVARGNNKEALRATPVTVTISIYIPWDAEPDVYRMTQTYSAFAI